MLFYLFTLFILSFIFIMNPGSTSAQEPQPLPITGEHIIERTQHSQLDIYPQKMVMTDNKLKQVQKRLENIVKRISEQRKNITCKLNEPDYPGIQKTLEQCTLEKNSQKQINPQRNMQNILNRLKQRQDKTKQKQNPKILQLIQHWAYEDEIDLITKEQMQKTVQFYQSKLLQKQSQYQSMKDQLCKTIKYLQLKIYTNTNINGQIKLQNQQEIYSQQQQNKQIDKTTNQATKQQQCQQSTSQPPQLPQSNLKQQIKLDEIPSQYSQLQALQQQNSMLQQQNKALQQKVQQLSKLNQVSQGECQASQSQLASLKAKLQQMADQMNSINSALNLQKTAYGQLTEKYGALQIKLQQKDKQLFKFINSQSNFAAQQLTNLQAALILEKEEKEKIKIQCNKKIEEMQQDVRRLNFALQNLKKQRQKQQSKNNSQNVKIVGNGWNMQQLAQHKQQPKQKKEEKVITSQNVHNILSILTDNSNNINIGNITNDNIARISNQNGQNLNKEQVAQNPSINLHENRVQTIPATLTEPPKTPRNLQEIPNVSAKSEAISGTRQKEQSNRYIEGVPYIHKQQQPEPKMSKIKRVYSQQQPFKHLQMAEQQTKKQQIDKIVDQPLKQKQNQNEIKSSESPGPQMRKSRHRLRIQHVLALDHSNYSLGSDTNNNLNDGYMVKIKNKMPSPQPSDQLKLTGYVDEPAFQNKNKNKVSEIVSKNLTIGNAKNNKQQQQDILKQNENEQIDQIEQPQNRKTDQVKFIRVLSIKDDELSTAINNTSCNLNQGKNGEEDQLDMKIIKQIILVPTQSIDQMASALKKLYGRLEEFKTIIQQDQKQQEIENAANTSKQNQQIPVNPTSLQKIKIAQQIKQSKNSENSNKMTVSKKSNTKKNCEVLNKSIYQLAKQLGEVSHVLVQNFQDQIIKSQSPQTIQKIRNVSKRQQQTKLAGKDKDKQENIVKPVVQQVEPPVQPATSTQKQLESSSGPVGVPCQPILQNQQDYNKAFKLINNQLKNVFQTFFNDSKVSIEQQQKQNPDFGTGSAKGSQKSIDSGTGPTFEDIKNEDQKSILQILRKLSDLHQQLLRKRKEISIKNKNKTERLFDVIRSMILNFKISYKAMNNILSVKQIGSQQNKSKYMHLRLYLESLYKALEHDHSGAKIGEESAPKDDSSTPVFTLYDNYDDKLEKLSSQLSKVRLQLDYKNQEHENLKQLTAKYLQVQKDAQQKKIQSKQLLQPENNKQQRQKSRSHSASNHKQQQNTNKTSIPIPAQTPKNLQHHPNPNNLQCPNKQNIPNALQQQKQRQKQQQKQQQDNYLLGINVEQINDVGQLKKIIENFKVKYDHQNNVKMGSKNGHKKKEKIIYVRK